MIIYYKIYKDCDTDLYSIHLSGISVSALIKLALAYRAREKRLHILIPQCLPRKNGVDKLSRCIKLSFHVSDPETVAFLKNGVREGYRTRYLKILLRQSLACQAAGACLVPGPQIEIENRLVGEIKTDELDDLLVIEPGNFKKNYMQMVQRCTLPDDVRKSLEKEEMDDEVLAGELVYIDETDEGPDAADPDDEYGDEDGPFPGL